MSFYLFYPPSNLVTIVGPVVVTGTVTANQGTTPWIVAGTVTANQGTNPWTVDGTVNIGNFPASTVVTQGTTPWIVGGTVAATQSGTWTTGRTWTLASGTDSVSAVQSGTWNIGTVTTLTSITNPVTVNQGTSPWVVSGTITTSPNVNVHDGSGVSISSTGSSLNVDVTNIVPVSQSTSPWVVSGTVTANAGTGNFTVVQPTGTNLHTVIDSGIVTANQGTAALPSNAWYVRITDGSTTAGVTNFGSNSYIVNGNGADAVPIRDGGNSITVDGTVTVNQGTSPWVVSGTSTVSGTVNVSNFPTTVDTNYGIVGANTLRSAAQIGNATGAADFNFGTVGAQTLRTAAELGNATGAIDYNFGTVGAQTIRVASQIGNATGAAAFNAGVTNAQTLRVVLPTDQTAIPVSQSGTWTVQPGNTANTTPWLVTDSSDGPVTPGTVASKSSLAGGQYNTTPPTLTNTQQVALQVDINGNLKTTATATIAGSVTVANLTFDSANSLYVDMESQKATYSAGTSFTAAVSATDVFTITGSGTKLIRISQISIKGTNTGNTNIEFFLIKRSTADSGGTSSTVTAVPHDSTSAAATATVRSYTVSPTLGTSVGTIRTDTAFFPTLASTNVGTVVENEFGVANTKSILLRGTSEQLVVNMGGILITGVTVLYIDITWTEE